MTKKPSKKTTSGQTEKSAAEAPKTETPKNVSPKTASPKAEKPAGETRSTVRGAPMEEAPPPAAPAHASVPRPSAPAPRRSEPAALAPTAKAAEPVPAQAPGPGPGPAHAPSAPADWEARLAAMESRIARAADRLEAMLERPAAVVPPAASPPASPAAAPPASSARKGKPAKEPVGAPAGPAGDDLDEVTTSFRRALGEALDRKLEEVIAPTVALYHRLRDEARALDEEASGPAVADLKALIADATSDVEKILRLLGGGFIAPERGEHYDPLIHLAVGEAPRPGGGAPEPSEGARSVASVVSEVVRPGYRSSRGRVVLPAKVTIERN